MNNVAVSLLCRQYELLHFSTGLQFGYDSILALLLDLRPYEILNVLRILILLSNQSLLLLLLHVLMQLREVFLPLDLVQHGRLVNLVMREVLLASEVRLVTRELLVTLHLQVVLLVLLQAQLVHSLLRGFKGLEFPLELKLVLSLSLIKLGLHDLIETLMVTRPLVGGLGH